MIDDANRQALDAVMPLLINDKGRRDLARATIQARTLRRFFNRDDLLRVHVVGRAAELPAIAEALQPFAAPWLQYFFWDEREALGAQGALSGIAWYKQQIIKMAAPEWLKAAVWLTLDADVICTKPVGIDDLFPGGRALMQCDTIAEKQPFSRWALGARSALGSVGPPLAYGMSITPLIYTAPIMQAAYAMIEFIHGRPWKEALLDPNLYSGSIARGEQAWAENLIYHTAAVRSGMLRKHHALSGIDTPQLIYSNGVWDPKNWQNWDVARAFDRALPGFFEVCSSYTGMPVEFVAERIEPFLAEDEATSAPAKPFVGVKMEDDNDEKGPTTRNLRVRLLSKDPLIVMGPYDGGLASIVSPDALAPVRGKPATVLLTLPACHEAVRDARRIVARIARRKREMPLHDFILLCNTQVELEVFRQFGVACYQVSHNALVNERPFAADGSEPVEFDAVYNAAFHPVRRHFLAAKIESLALIYAPWHKDPGFAGYIEESHRLLSHATLLNQPKGQEHYHFFQRDELARQLSRARVGLCLSAKEGPMRASIEYLHAGLPVVSTFAIGGRDEFFDADFCAIVPPTAELVAAAVKELAARNLSRTYVRERTLHKLASHRERFVEAVMRAVQEAGKSLTAPLVMPWLDEEVFTIQTIEEFHAKIV